MNVGQKRINEVSGEEEVINRDTTYGIEESIRLMVDEIK